MNRMIWIGIIFMLLPFTVRPEGLHDPSHVQVYLVPMSDFPEPLSAQLAKALSEDFGFWVKSSLRIGKLAIDVMPGTNQLPGEEILSKSQNLIRAFPEGSIDTYFLLLTTKDINSKTRGFRFQFAMHNKELKTSVLSLARLLDYKDGRPVFNYLAVERLFKMSKRAIGELHLGWERSSNPEDVMYSPLMGISDLDRIGTEHFGGEKESPPSNTNQIEFNAI